MHHFLKVAIGLVRNISSRFCDMYLAYQSVLQLLAVPRHGRMRDDELIPETKPNQFSRGLERFYFGLPSMTTMASSTCAFIAHSGVYPSSLKQCYLGGSGALLFQAFWHIRLVLYHWRQDSQGVLLEQRVQR
jgi:hypothetical protein